MSAGLGAFLVVVALLGATPHAIPQPAASPPIVGARYNLLRDGVATDVGAIRTPVIRWTFQTNGSIATSPLAADVDGDGTLEVVLSEVRAGPAADASRLGYVLDSAGHAKYTVPLRYDASVAAIADLDGDGKPEIVFAEGSHTDHPGALGYRVFRGAGGAPAWAFTTPFIGGEGFFASPAVADLDGDGKLDLVAGSMDHSVYALRGSDGAVLWHSAPLEHYVRNSPPLADLDGDGRLDVTVQTEAGVVHTYDAATGAPKWSADLGDIVAATPAIGDLDGDGKPEIVYSLVVEGGVVALHGDGTMLWTNTAHDFSYRGPTLVDVNGDGLRDVVEGDSGDPSITAYRGTDGAILWDTDLDAPWASGPLVSADIDGDGVSEILAGSDAGLIVLNARTGAIEWTFPLPPIRGEPLVRDIDGDGLAEIPVGAGDGKLYVLGTQPVAGTLRIEPRTLNLRSQGRWVSARLDFAEPVAGDVDPSSLRLGGVAADRVDVLGDSAIRAKFPRGELASVLAPGAHVEVCAAGFLLNDRPFRVCDSIRVISPGR